jgi:hypothetical protein
MWRSDQMSFLAWIETIVTSVFQPKLFHALLVWVSWPSIQTEREA